MNILIAPFHDWRKILLEGPRTRDSHFIEQFQRINEITIIVNRPTTIAEIILKRKLNLIKSKVLVSKNGFRLYQYSPSMYIIDYVSKDIFGQIFKKHNWFVKKYGDTKYITFINDCLKKLDVKDDYVLLNQNVFAANLTKNLKPIKSLFDAWDNFMKFDVYNDIKHVIAENYMIFSKQCDFWITNSNDNIQEFKTKYLVKNICLIKNGVDVSKFTSKSKNIPNDILRIKRPIVGFGGKITHLIDVDLINKTMALKPEMSFVFVGQILNKEIFNNLHKRDNFYYLGDKHYDVYPDYVKNFDICTVPYVTEEQKKSGANTIKVYEYLATNKKVVGTPSSGLEDLQEFVYIINNAEEFAYQLDNLENHKRKISLEEHAWYKKAHEIIDLVSS